ncbi:hypothetical protein EJV47_00835 [Hymenobacter gummosus]|uniref:SdiA-regulated family protein n=1 Tax=Hymenobacter gummosus TaxID=1776032 RepID=A0A3S0HC90_9BACT|nr:SdiA-regulated domain-containing protein [Hymenobacter gummosus]RTQ53316.1 hypothetical protein EJV47_00835 [Hymenobacter gummosus]
MSINLLYPLMLVATPLAFTLLEEPAPPVARKIAAYDFAQPAASYPMPAELREISGIALAGPGQVACVEDEDGELYFYNTSTKRVERKESFAGAGDYEDVARVGDAWLVLRSDGTIFRYRGKETTEHKTGLSFANEPEGLTYDAASNTLLVACKGEAGAGLGSGQRAIYRLNPTTLRIEPQPAYVLDVNQIWPAAEGKKEGKFSPSAVAVHPRTRHVFVLSARQNGLVELDAAGRLVAAQALPTALFPQPEGLAFAANGDLYVSTEAGKKSGEARVYLFRAR